MTFEEFMLELGKEWPTQLLTLALLIGLSMFRFRMKNNMTKVKDADGNKIKEQLRELLEKYGSHDFVCLVGLTHLVITIGRDFVVRIETQEHAFLIEYLFRPRFKYALVYHYRNSVRRQKIGVYTDLEKLVHDYIKINKDFQEKEKLQKLQEDF